MSRFNLSAVAVSIVTMFASTAAFSGPLGYAPQSQPPNSIFEQALRDGGNSEDQQEVLQIPAHLRRQMVVYQTREAPGSIIIDTPNTQIYYVLGGGRAIRTASVSVVRASLGLVCRRSCENPNGRIGIRRRK